MPPVPESEVQKACLHWLKTHSKVAKVWRNNSGMIKTDRGGMVRLGEVGSPDIMGFFKNSCVFFGVEVKRQEVYKDGRKKNNAEKKLSEPQREWLKAITAEGGLGTVINSVDQLEQDFKIYFSTKKCKKK